MVGYNRKSREDRIQEIHNAALQVFLEKGYRNTTMEDIVGATSLSKGGLYHYYGSTKDILFDIMKYGNYSFFYDLKIDPNWSNEEICAFLTEICLTRILEKTPARKLYLMFSYEMLYDSDFEVLFLELENQAFNLFRKLIQAKSDLKFSSNNKQLFFSRFVNALLFAQNLFSDSNILIEERSLLYKYIYDICLEMFE